MPVGQPVLNTTYKTHKQKCENEFIQNHNDDYDNQNHSYDNHNGEENHTALANCKLQSKEYKLCLKYALDSRKKKKKE